ARTAEATPARGPRGSGRARRFAGRFSRFQDARMWPKPVRGTVPVVIGGHSEAAARRAGRLGDGYFPASADPASIPGLINVLREAAAGAGRDPATVEVTVGGRGGRDAFERMATLGVDRVVIPLRAADLDGAHATIEAAAEAGRAAGVLTAR